MRRASGHARKEPATTQPVTTLDPRFSDADAAAPVGGHRPRLMEMWHRPDGGRRVRNPCKRGLPLPEPGRRRVPSFSREGVAEVACAAYRSDGLSRASQCLAACRVFVADDEDAGADPRDLP